VIIDGYQVLQPGDRISIQNRDELQLERGELPLYVSNTNDDFLETRVVDESPNANKESVTKESSKEKAILKEQQENAAADPIADDLPPLDEQANRDSIYWSNDDLSEG